MTATLLKHVAVKIGIIAACVFDVFLSKLISYHTFSRNFVVHLSYVFRKISFGKSRFFVKFSHVRFLRNIFGRFILRSAVNSAPDAH